MLLLAEGERLNVNARTYPKESALSLAARRGILPVVDSILRDPPDGRQLRRRLRAHGIMVGSI